MEAIIRTNDSEAFNSLVLFLKTLHFEVETKKEKSMAVKIQKRKDFSKAVKFWNSFSVDMSNFKLNREDAYQR